MARADRLPGFMEVNRIFAIRIVRRQIGAAAEPVLVSLGEEAKVGMDGRHERAARVQD